MVCAGCRFYRPLTPAAGQCRRFPPLLVLGEPAWIVVASGEAGCGEFVGIQRPADDQDAPP